MDQEERKSLGESTDVSESSKKTFNIVSMLAKDMEVLIDIENSSIKRLMDIQEEQKKVEYALKRLRKFDPKFKKTPKEDYQLELDAGEQCGRFCAKMLGYKLPEIKGVCFNYITSLNRAPKKVINDFFLTCMPNTLPEFWLTLHAVNKCEINGCFSKVFPKVTEKLMICDTDITEKD